ncbi:MAG: Qat anti-phage system QueC-like protein QatC [Janthinobacterium lividum]
MEFTLALTEPTLPGSFAHVRLTNTAQSADLKFDQAEDLLRMYRPGTLQSELVLDLMLLGATAFALDRLVKRSAADDAWTRDIALELPVSDVALWQQAQDSVERCLTFLSGDEWQVRFVPRVQKLVLPGASNNNPVAQVVSLYSGGLDSFIGAIDYLAQHPGHAMVLVGHRDFRGVRGVMSDQDDTFAALEQEYPGRVHLRQAVVGCIPATENTLRSRSLLFLCMGLVAAHGQGDNIALMIPENGNIALNSPLTPARTGSCSTRTVHPQFLDYFRDILRGLGIRNEVQNPLGEKTKGECVRQCLNQPLLLRAHNHTNSCAKRSHRVTWLNRQASHCGRCMPCIYRRAALHTIGADTAVYGRDICQGEVDPLATAVYTNDFRACLALLQDNPSQRQVARSLLASGHLNLAKLQGYAAVFRQALQEVRALLAAKATAPIKHAAGIP